VLTLILALMQESPYNPLLCTNLQPVGIAMLVLNIVLKGGVDRPGHVGHLLLISASTISEIQYARSTNLDGTEELRIDNSVACSPKPGEAAGTDAFETVALSI
jgi:hypothetical protein